MNSRNTIMFLKLEAYQKLVDNDLMALGLYLTKEDDTFIAVDNTTNDCWIEEFDTFDEAVKWLFREEEKE